MAVQSIALAAQIDHAALDRIMTHLERRYGHDPRVDRGFRLFMGGKVSLFPQEPTTALVTGDSGQTYTATAFGFCECPDAQKGNICKHQIACKIACQMRAVEQAKAQQQAQADDLRATFNRLTREHQQHGRALIASGVRPIDDAVYQERDLLIQRIKDQLPPVTLIA